MRLRDALARHEPAQRVPAQRHDQGRVEDLELALEVRRAGRDLVGLRVAVVGRAALHDVRDEDLVAAPAERAQVLRQELAGATDERPAEPILVESRALADEHDLGVGAALAGDGVRAGLMEAAAGAGADLGRHVVERHLALVVGHADPPATAAPLRRHGTARRRGRRPGHPAAGEERLRDLDGVRRRALAQVVAHDPEREAAAVGDGFVGPDAADVDLVGARRRRSRAGRSRSTGRPGRRRPARGRRARGPGRGSAARASRRGPPRSGRRRPARGRPWTRFAGPAGAGSCGSR